MSDENRKLAEKACVDADGSLESRSGPSLGPYGNYVYPTVYRGCSRMYGNGHNGLDIRDQSSDHSIYAFAEGTVSFVQNVNNTTPGSSMWTMGNCIAVNHPNPITSSSGKYVRTIYMHMRDVPALKPGQKVARGQFLGVIGSTGESTGNHLHFSMAIGDNTALRPGTNGWASMSTIPLVNPAQFLPEYYQEG